MTVNGHNTQWVLCRLGLWPNAGVMAKAAIDSGCAITTISTQLLHLIQITISYVAIRVQTLKSLLPAVK